MNYQEAKAAFEADRDHLEASGIILPFTTAYIPTGAAKDIRLAMDAFPGLAMDAQPSLVTDPNSAVPAMLTTMIDPTTIRVLFAPTKAAQIVSEVKKGTWLDETIMFPVTEETGEVSSYDDFAENGRSGVNINWPQRQSYLFQIMKEYGERELERAGLAKINFVSELDRSAAGAMMRFQNLSYFFGVAGLSNYGLLNDPNLSASLTPATKAAGGVKWINGTQIVATANEVYADVQSVFFQLVAQSGGLVDEETALTLAMSPGSSVALTATNSFGVNVKDLLKKNFPNLKVITAIQYGAISAANPNGVAAGNLMQMIAGTIENQETAFCSFNEKMRAHKLIPRSSSWRQKVTGGTWGTVIRQPFAIASMVGI
jgi:hypothetical protein